MVNLTKSDRKLLLDAADKLESEAIYRSKEISINIGIHTEIPIPPVVDLLKILANDEELNECQHICRLVVAWMCKYCPNYFPCQTSTPAPSNYIQMCKCLDNGVMFNTGHYPEEHEIKRQVI